MVHGGVCLTRLDDGTTLFVEGGIPGETAAVELMYRKKKVWFGRVAEVVESSPYRVDPPCKYFGACGGCQLQHIDYAHQLELKREILTDALRRQHVEFPEIQMHGMKDPWRYRWRGEFHVVPGEQGLADAKLGFNRQRSWKPIAVDDCLIHHPTITSQIEALRAVVARGGREGLDTLHLTVGNDGDELLISARPKGKIDVEAIDAVAADADGTWSTSQTTLTWRDHRFRVSPESFIQVNQGMVDTLYGLVIDAVPEAASSHVIDAYAGIGMMATILASAGARVTCIENNRSSVTMGMLNAELNQVAHFVKFELGAVEDVLAPILSKSGADTVILDPPRAGCENSVSAFLALSGPPRLIYVSCEPSTLARDLRILAASGPYRIKSLHGVDMFAHTHHLETVVVMERLA